MSIKKLMLAGLVLAAQTVVAHDNDGDDNRGRGKKDKTLILATGRRDPRMYTIDLKKAILPANQNTPNAILSRSKTSLDGLDGKMRGDPANLAISEDGKKALVVNHHGDINNDEFLQHGGRGNLSIMDIAKMANPYLDNTAASVERQYDTGGFGAVGIILLPDLYIFGSAEGWLTEDGGNRINFVDRRTGALRGSVEQRLGTPAIGTCPTFPVPFTSPNGPPTGVAVLSPNASWGCFPDTNGLVLGHGSDGKSYIFAANGGTDDVSVVDLESALSGNKTAEINRIPTQIGPWGIAVSPNGKTVVAANRESQRVAFEGNTVSFIDVDLARQSTTGGGEVNRLRVCTDDPNVQTRPFIPSFTPDGKKLIVPCFRTNNVSIIDVAKALANLPGAEIARIPLTRVADIDAVVRPARPKGSAVTADGRYAVISAGPRTSFVPYSASGYVYVIDLQTNTVVGTVTGVGNDPYGLAVTRFDD